MIYNRKKDLKLMILRGPLTKEQLKNSHPISRLVLDEKLRIVETNERNSLAGRTKVGRPIRKDFFHGNQRGDYCLESAVAEAIELSTPDIGLILISHYQDNTKISTEVQYYSSIPEDTIEYFI